MVRRKLIWLCIIGILTVNVPGKDLPGKQLVDTQLYTEIGQMLIIGFGGLQQDEDGKILWDDRNNIQFKEDALIAKHIANNHVGGIILFTQPLRDINTRVFIRDRNVQNPKQVAKLNQNLQDYNSKVRKEQGLEVLPLFIGIDQEGGIIDRLPPSHGFSVPTVLPQALGAQEERFLAGIHCQGARHARSVISLKKLALEQTYKYAKKMAKELRAVNFNLNFAPVVDVNISPLNPIIGRLGRSFSSCPQVVVNQAEQFIRAFREQKIVAVLKHFPGHGSSLQDSHLGLVDVTTTYQKDKELYPYFSLITAGYPGMIMTAHVINGQLDDTQCKNGSPGDHTTWCPGTMSQKTLTGLLRNTMGFNGIIVSDDMTMGAITREYTLSEALQHAINAGIDIFIVANNSADQTDMVINTIAQLVVTGAVKREKITAAYRRIVNFKKKYLLS